MSDGTVIIEIDSAALTALFERAAGELRHSDELMALIAARLHRAVDLNFQAEGRPTKWAPIKRQGKILADSGALKSSITEHSDATTATVGTNKIYGRWQHFGTRPYTIRAKRKKALAWKGRDIRLKKSGIPGSSQGRFWCCPPKTPRRLPRSSASIFLRSSIGGKIGFLRFEPEAHMTMHRFLKRILLNVLCLSVLTAAPYVVGAAGPPGGYKATRQAAEQGNAGAQSNLGVMYALGKGVPQDLVYAHMWFNIAAANGYNQAAEARDISAEIMTSSQKEEAQQRARACVAQHCTTRDTEQLTGKST